MISAVPRLQMTSMVKRFGAVAALSDVSLTVAPNEVHGLLGGNGAGKTTLMNILYGLYKADAGSITIDGQEMDISSPRGALAAGVGMVHQTFLQISTYSVVENIVLGTDEVGGMFSLDLDQARDKVVELSERFGLHVDPEAIVETLPVGIRQRVEILKALYRGSKILILDEPTTNLTPHEVDDLFESIKTMVAEGMSVILITHKIRETMSICNRMTVMRHGVNVATVDRADTDEEQLAALMVGETAAADAQALEAVMGIDSADAVEVATIETTEPELVGVPAPASDTGVTARGLTIANDFGVDIFRDFSITIPAGQIIGVAGVAGNGQVELAEALAGVRAIKAGIVNLHGSEMAGLTTAQWLESGVAYVPEDRHRDGILPTSSITENLLLGSERKPEYKRLGLIDWRAARQRAVAAIDEFSVRASGPGAKVGELSGGNIQRVILARAFARTPRLLVLHNPTRGLDIESTQFVYSQVRKATAAGCAVLLLSEDLDEIMTLSDHIVALFAGRQTGSWTHKEADAYEIGRCMTGLEQT